MYLAIKTLFESKSYQHLVAFYRAINYNLTRKDRFLGLLRASLLH